MSRQKMKGRHLRFYMYEFEKHKHTLLYEWLIELAKKEKAEGATVTRALAGFGRKKSLHEEGFVELASNVPIIVNLILSEEKATQFIEKIKLEKLDLFYSITPCEYGFL